jgi:nicotinate-nucleotide--dimethylbenzimidazole phosphoribosyltransferase
VANLPDFLPESATQLFAPSNADRSVTQHILNSLTKPIGSLGRVEDLALWSASVQAKSPPVPFANPQLVIFAGDHGVSARGTSALPSDVTAQMVANLCAGGAAANVLAERSHVTITVVDVCVDSEYAGLQVPAVVFADRIRRGSASIDTSDAMTHEEATQAWALGVATADRLIDSGADLLIAGDMGIGNTTPATALIARLTESAPNVVCGRGTGISDETWMIKVAAIRDALWRSRDVSEGPLDLLASLGGPDLAAICGFLAQGAQRRTPAILDGVISCVAALLVERDIPGSVQWWVAGHRSTEPAQTRALAELGLEPILDLGMRLGEGTGALMALPVIQAAIALTNQMATFETAGISPA